MNSWLSMLRFSEYYSLFITAGYDLQTVSRMTPEDFTAIGNFVPCLIQIKKQIY